MKLQTDAQIAEGARLAIFNTEKDPDMQKRMAAFGFTGKRIQDGKALLENAKLFQDVTASHYEDRWVIAQQIDANQKAVRVAFKEHVDIARIAFRKDPALLHRLKIQGISKKRWEWPRQASHFYTQIEAHMTLLLPFGITQEVIVQAKASVQALLALKEDRFQKKGLAEDSTQHKKKAFKALKGWVQEFRSVACIAFKDNPQLLEAFGMPVSSKV